MEQRKNAKGRALCIGKDNSCNNIPIREEHCWACKLLINGIDVKGVKKLTTDDFIERSNIVHDNMYTYDKVVYTGNKCKVKIDCPTHGEFEQIATAHMKGNGCRKCSKSYPKTTASWKTAVIAVHGDKYDYTNSVYIDSNTLVRIICPTHGEFEQLPGSHLQGKGCVQCGIELNAERCRKDLDHFIAKAQLCHKDHYDYSKVTYEGSGINVTIICRKCNREFQQTPDNHYNGKGCRYCTKSKAEITICGILADRDINYEEQKTFPDCKNVRPLPFDFYIPSMNLLIEADGKQHFESCEIFGGETAYKKRQLHDAIKDEWIRNSNYCLLRIPYNCDPEAAIDTFIDYDINDTTSMIFALDQTPPMYKDYLFI